MFENINVQIVEEYSNDLFKSIYVVYIIFEDGHKESLGYSLYPFPSIT